MNRSLTTLSLSLVVATLVGAVPNVGRGASIKIEYPGKVIDCQGVAALRPVNHERWTPLEDGMLLSKGDWIRTEVRGANAVQIRLANQDRITLGPGGLIELVDENTVSLIRGEAEVTPVKDGKLTIRLPGSVTKTFGSSTILRATETAYTVLDNEPNWLKYLKGTVTHESMGSLVAKVEGRDLPLTLGYHKVTIDIRDQIARTVIEESFVNHTSSQLEGVFFFPLPQDASIAGFAMWIGDQLVEADVVEKQRAREIYETILREKRDPGLLEWSGGNIFKARVFPIFGHSEKRIRIEYTQVLPRNGNQYLYSYALQSEMLKQTPLRELALKVNIFSEEPIANVTCLSHNARVNKTKNAATIEFAAQEYTPTQDFEVEIEVNQGGEPIVLIPHRRGDDGYFLLLVNPPDKQRKSRPLLGDGPPLDLIVVADTSASMDRQQRQLQDQFIGFLLGSLGKKDLFRVVAADAETAWFNPATNTPPDKGCLPSEEDIEKARSFLAGRISLGWTDIGKTLEEVLKFAGKDTHVIYVGDGIDTSKDSDPGAISKNLKRVYLASGSASAVHAVAVSSSYEPMVMKTMAGLGGGSFRRLDGAAPARNGAMGLLEELTAPGIRDMKVEFKGLRAARVYPDELPNLPAGRQQIVLGRYLPEGKDQKGTVIVTGNYRGKTVRYEDAVAFKDAESGNAFIPRLWARMHLESLLEQGQSAEVKNDVIALSEEYAIMTPYTSFLVLESDKDRERFAVKRRFKMRDGEKFFAEGRDAAGFQLRQKQMQSAGAWRQDLRRQFLRDLMAMGRILPSPQPYPEEYDYYMDIGHDINGTMGFGGGARSRMNYKWRADKTPMSAPRPSSVINSFGAPEEIDELITTRSMDQACKLGFDGSDVSDYFDGDLDGEPSADAEMKEDVPPKHQFAETSRRLINRESRQFADTNERMYSRSSLLDMKKSQSIGGYLSGGAKKENYRHLPLFNQYWHNTLFPNVPPAPPSIATPANTNWPDTVRALSQSLLRQDKLNAMTGGIEITANYANIDRKRKQVIDQTVYETLYSPKAWIQTTRPASGQTIVEWSDGKERGIFAPCYQLGRTRAAEESDANLRQQAYSDFSCTPLEGSYGQYTPELRSEDGGTTLVVFRYRDNTNYEWRCRIDTARHVLLANENWNLGKLQSRTTFADFIQVAGTWWATRISTEDGEGRQVSSIRVDVRQIDDRTLAKELGSRMATTRKDSIIISSALPAMSAARQAEKDKKVSFEQYLTLISQHIQLQEHDEILADWTAAKALVKDKPGADWMDTEILLQTRRNEEARLKIRQSTARLVETPDQDDLYLANTLHNQISRIGQYNEVLVLLDALKPVYQRQPKHLNAVRTFSMMYAETLRNVGRTEESLVIWRKLAKEFPADIGLQTRYMQVLAEQGRQEEAFDRLEELLAKSDFWTAEERNSIRSSVVYSLANRVQADKWIKFLEAWLAEGTEDSNVCQFYLSALLSLNKVADLRQVMTKWIEEGIAAYAPNVPTESDARRRQQSWNRLQAAINMALGHGYNVYTDHIDPYWYPLLSRTVKELFNTDSASYLAGQIIQHHRFAQTDEARKLRRHFVTILSKETMTLKPHILNQVINWISNDDPKVDKEVWDDLASRIEERWAKETDINARNQLGTAVWSAIYKSNPETGLTRFLRRQFKESPKEQVTAHARTLFYHLLGGKWSEVSETELFTILPRLSPATNDEQRVAELVPCLYDMTDRLVPARINAGISSTEARSKMTLQELAAEQDKLRTAAKEGLIERLKKESPTQEECLRHWFTIERLTIEVQLNKDAKSIAGECWEMLPRKPWGNAETNMMRMHLLDRATTTLACLAARRSTDAQLVARLLAFFDEGIKDAATTAKPESANNDESDDPKAYWRYQKYRLLAARDEAKALEENLVKWIEPDKADPAWRLALGYLMAEQGRIADAISQFEALEKADLLGQQEFKALSDWYMATDQRDKHETALVKALSKLNESDLSNRLHRHLNAWQQGADKVPKELGPEVPRILTALFAKAQNPYGYIYQLQQFYHHSRDPRLLQCLAEGVLGHTTQQAYPFLQSMSQILNEIRDESAADTVLQRIAAVRPSAKTTVDNRALDFLELQVCRRAAEVKNQPGQHIGNALAAMQRSFKGDWATGERRLMAQLLAGLGRITSEDLSREQLRQLKELHLCRTEPAEDRLYMTLCFARTLSSYEKYDDAIDALDAALTEYRQTMGGTLLASANNAMEEYVGFLEGRQRFSRGETWLQEELKRPANQQQQYWLVRRLLALYVNAVRNRAETSLGRGEALYRAAYAKMLPELECPDRGHRLAVVSSACTLFECAKTTGIEPREARDFAFTVFPAVLAKETEANSYNNQLSQVAQTLHRTLGALTALEFLIERVEQEPQWMRINWYHGAWRTHSHELGAWREQAKPTGALESRLLKVVTAELRRDLTERREGIRYIYGRHHSYFWNEKAAEFQTVAEEVWRENRTSGAAVLYIAAYLWSDLDIYDRAIEMLAEAHTSQLLEESGQATLVSYLHSRNRHAESVPILIGLITQRPDAIQYRTQLMTAYFKTQDGDKLKKTLADADKHFHEGGRWQENNIAALAYSCVETRLSEDAVKYYDELIPMRKRNNGGRVAGDGQLSEYYRQLANAHINLGHTVEAVDAASGSIVVWGQDQNSRNNAMNGLTDVMRRAPDLPKYVTFLEKQVAESKLENPILRKALGRVFLEKKDIKEAIRHLSLALEVQSNDRETCDALVSAYDQMNDKPGAIRQILTTVDLSRRDIALYAELGKRYLADGDKVQSERAYLSIPEMLPNESESHTMLAEIRQQQNRWDEAIHHWRQVVRVRSLEPTGFQKLAEALIHQKQWKEAIENIDILAKRTWPDRFGDVRAITEQLRRKVDQQK